MVFAEAWVRMHMRKECYPLVAQAKMTFERKLDHLQRVQDARNEHPACLYISNSNYFKFQCEIGG
jgi:hypothetical protein